MNYLLSNEVYTYASATAFNALIAFFPATVVVLTAIRGLFGSAGLYRTTLEAVVAYLPLAADDRAYVLWQLAKVSANFSGLTLLWLAILLFSAVGIFVPVELALNHAWKVPAPRHWAASQAISFVLLVSLGALVIVPIGIAYEVGRAVAWALWFLPDDLIAGIRLFVLKVATLPFTVVGLALVYWVLPKRRMSLDEVVPAAVFAGLLFELGKYVYIGLLPFLEFQKMYGRFYLSVTLITWALFSSMILMLGAYLTAEDLLPRRLRRPPAVEAVPGGR